MLLEGEAEQIKFLIELRFVELRLRIDVVVVDPRLKLNCAAPVSSFEASSEAFFDALPHIRLSSWNVGWWQEDFLTKDPTLTQN